MFLDPETGPQALPTLFLLLFLSLSDFSFPKSNCCSRLLFVSHWSFFRTIWINLSLESTSRITSSISHPNQSSWFMSLRTCQLIIFILTSHNSHRPSPLQSFTPVLKLNLFRDYSHRGLLIAQNAFTYYWSRVVRFWSISC